MESGNAMTRKCHGIDMSNICAKCPLHVDSAESYNLTCPLAIRTLKLNEDNVSNCNACVKSNKKKRPSLFEKAFKNKEKDARRLLRHGLKHKDFRFSFGNGLLFESTKHSYDVEIVNLDTGNVLFNATTIPHVPIFSPHKFYVRYGIRLFRKKKKVFSHDLDLKGKNVLVWSLSRLIGDNFAWIDSVLRFKEKHECNVTCAIPPFLIETFSRTFPELDFTSNKKRMNQHEYYATYYILAGGEKSNFQTIVHHRIEKLNRIPDYILGLQFAKNIRKFKATEDFRLDGGRKYVCYSETASIKMKEWGNRKALLDTIRHVQSLGYAVINIDVKPKTKNIEGVIYQNGKEHTIQDRINVLSNAEFFICNPSGLGWVARACGIPVIMIGSFSLPISEWENPYRIICTDYCFGCWNYSDSKLCVRTQDKYICNKSITSKMVIEKIDLVLSDKKNGLFNPEAI